MSDVQDNSVAEDTAKPCFSVGTTLRSARVAQGLTIQEIADRTKYGVRQVDALERDDIACLPQGTFLRGFIRSYARVVQLDPAMLLSATETHTEHHFDMTDVQDGGEPLPLAGVTQRKNIYLLLAALLIALGIALFLFSHRDDSPQPEHVIPADSATPKPQGSESIEPASAVNGGKAGSTGLPITDVKSETGTDKSVVPSVAADPEKAKPPVKREVPLEQLMKRPIHIVFLEDAWVEVTDASGEVLISRITEAGGEKWIGGAGRAPYQVTIGRAGAVRLYHGGKEVDLSGFKADGVARLVLE